MSKEQLEQMEHDYKNAFPINIEWLLDYAKEQFERVQEMEARHYRQELIDEHIERLEQQNKRYREAMEKIISNWVKSTDAISGDVLAYEFSQLARKALEESE